ERRLVLVLYLLEHSRREVRPGKPPFHRRTLLTLPFEVELAIGNPVTEAPVGEFEPERQGLDSLTKFDQTAHLRCLVSLLGGAFTGQRLQRQQPGNRRDGLGTESDKVIRPGFA